MTQSTDTTRRTLLKGSALAMTLGLTGVVNLLTTSKAHAAWPTDAFSKETISETMQSLFDRESVPADSANVTLKAPDIAENGAVVPISVKSSLPNVSRIVILVEDNPNPMTASFNLGKSVKADVSTRIKMGTTSNVIALVEADGEIYAATKNVKVTIGGCGG